MKRILLLIVVLSGLLTVGCWDMREINQRILPYSVGVDLNDKDKDETKYNISFTYPNINAMGKNPKSDKRTYLIEQKANNIFDATHKLTIRNYEPIDLKHLKVLIVSKEVVADKKMFRGILDGINRDYRINKMVEILITENTVEEFLKVKQESERQETAEGGIYSMLRGEQEASRFTPKTLDEFIEDMDTCRAAHVPMGSTDKDEFIISGAGIFKDFKFVGELDGEENKNIAILNGDIMLEGIGTKYKGEDLSVEVYNVKSKQKLIDSKDNIKIKYLVNIKGQIHQYTLSDGNEIDTDKVLGEMDKAIEEKLQKDLRKVIDRIQKELNADIIGIYKYLYEFHPKVWDRVKDDWDTIFPKVDIDLDIKLDIRRRGLTT